MNNIDNNSLIYVSRFLDINNTEILCLNKRSFIILKKFFKEKLDKQIEFLNKVEFNYKIIKMFGGLKNMAMFPILKWDKKFEGPTGYIDQILPSDLKDSIMIGVDAFERPFITLKLLNKHKNNNNRLSVVVLFQRYGNYKKTWTHSNYNFCYLTELSGYFILNNVITHTHIEDNIKRLLENKGSIKYTNIKGEIQESHVILYN